MSPFITTDTFSDSPCSNRHTFCILFCIAQFYSYHGHKNREHYIFSLELKRDHACRATNPYPICNTCDWYLQKLKGGYCHHSLPTPILLCVLLNIYISALNLVLLKWGSSCELHALPKRHCGIILRLSMLVGVQGFPQWLTTNRGCVEIDLRYDNLTYIISHEIIIHCQQW